MAGPQLLSIYRKDCVIRLPFLRLAAISPEALLTPDGAETKVQETLSYLCDDYSEVRTATRRHGPLRPR